MTVKIKRVYEEPSSQDGKRILIDRLWPRGISKEKGKIDIWMKDIAPSTELRKWFGHDPAKWEEFQKKYLDEIRQNPSAVSQLKEQVKEGNVTLVYGAKDIKHNDAVVLKEFLEKI